MKLHVRVPISARPAWFNRVRLIKASILQWYPDATFQIVIGQSLPADPSAAAPDDLRHECVWTDPDRFNEWRGTRSEHLETMMHRYRNPYDGTHILQLDADVICTRRFDELFEVDALQGVQAHVPPVSWQEWQAILHNFGAPMSDTAQFEYSGWGTMVTNPAARHAPIFYPNSGVIFGPRHLFEQLESHFHDAITWLRSVWSDTYWFDQVGFALGCARAKVPVKALPLRYNFPNQHSFDVAHPKELADVRFIHYLRTDTVHRDEDFKTLEAMRRLADRRDLGGSNEVLRQRVAALMRIFDPAPLSCAEDAPWA